MRKKLLTALLLSLSLVATPLPARAEEGQEAREEVTSVAPSEGTAPTEAQAAPQQAGAAAQQGECMPTPPAGTPATATPEPTGGQTVSDAAGSGTPDAPLASPAVDQVDTDSGETAGAVGEQAAGTDDLGASSGTVPEDGALTAGDTQQLTAGDTTAGHPSSLPEGSESLGAPSPSGEALAAPALTDNAVYAISAASAPKLAVAANAGGNVELATSRTLLGEYWRAIDAGDGAYLLVNLDGSRALAVSGTIKNGTNVVVSATGTRWKLVKNADGTTYTVIPMGNVGYCLDVYGAGSAAGSNLQLYAINGNETQRFSFALHKALTDAVSNACDIDGAYTIKPQANGSLAFDIASGSNQAGANTRLWTANGSLAQTYDFSSLGNGLFVIRAGHSGKVLDVQGGSTAAGANVRQYTRNNTLAQIWYLVSDGSGYRILNAKSGRALDLAGSAANKSANVQLGANGTSGSQVFVLAKANLLAQDGVYAFNPQNAASLFVAVSGNSTSTSAAVRTSKDGSVLGQYWRVSIREDGAVVLVNLRSGASLDATQLGKGTTLAVSADSGLALRPVLNDDGTLTLRCWDNAALVLDVKGGSTAAGAALQLWTSNGSKAQCYAALLQSALTAAVRAGSPIKTGIYQIGVASVPSLVLDIQGGTKAAGGNVQLYSNNGSGAQKFMLVDVGNGLYTIQSGNSDKMLAVANGSVSSGANVVQDGRDQTLAQYWYVMSNGKGAYSIRNAKSGHALDVKNGSIEKRGNIQIHSYNGTAAELFVFTDAQLIKNGTYSFSSALTITSLVLEVAGGSVEDGANVVGYQCNGTDAQKWVLKHVGGGLFTVQNLKSGLYLDVEEASTANGANVVQSAQSGSDSQRWLIGLTESGALTFMNVKSGRYLDVAGGKVANGVNIRQWNGNGTASQGWNIKTDNDPRPAGKLGTFIARMVYYCDIANVGYDQSNRWDIRDGGECDCSSLTIACLKEADFITDNEYQKTIFYTGNMSEVLTKRGWTRMKANLDTLKPGDILLNDAYHVCVVISGYGKNAMIAQASIGDGNRVRGGQAGDQTGYETNIKQVYNYSYGWDCILRYTA